MGMSSEAPGSSCRPLLGILVIRAEATHATDQGRQAAPVSTIFLGGLLHPLMAWVKCLAYMERLLPASCLPKRAVSSPHTLPRSTRQAWIPPRSRKVRRFSGYERPATLRSRQSNRRGQSFSKSTDLRHRPGYLQLLRGSLD